MRLSFEKRSGEVVRPNSMSELTLLRCFKQGLSRYAKIMTKRNQLESVIQSADMAVFTYTEPQVWTRMRPTKSTTNSVRIFQQQTNQRHVGHRCCRISLKLRQTGYKLTTNIVPYCHSLANYRQMPRNHILRFVKLGHFSTNGQRFVPLVCNY